VRAIVAASLLVTTLLSAATAHARDVGDDPVPVVVDDGQDQVVGTVPSDPPSPDVPVVVENPRLACIRRIERPTETVVMCEPIKQLDFMT
jgi:hypothetical protein